MLNAMDAPISPAHGPLDCRILLAEDDRDHQPLLCLMLEKAGSEVTIAENGRLAVDLACEARNAGRPFELIVMDLQMPVLDGLSATRELRADGFSSPIIALTARAVSTDRDRCFAAGCDDFLSKPVSRFDLVRLLAAHLKRTRLAHATS
ncbi:MAG: response regulator [Planctomycetaceae bacterium]|nr:response regulator [Planctomycetaceae bacterium]